MRASTFEGAAFCLILGLGACADGLAEAPGGMAVLVGGVAVSGLLVQAAHTRVRQTGWAAAQKAGQIRLRWRIWHKKKAAGVVGTPQRQVKHRRKSDISPLHFIGA